MAHKEKIDILVPENGGKIGAALIGSLRARGLSVKVLDDPSSPAGIGRIDKDEAGFIRRLKAELTECAPRMILPVFKSEWIARHRSELPKGIIIPIASESELCLLDDKCRASELCTQLGIPQPRLYSDDELSTIGHYPVVFKRSQGLSGSGVYFPKNRESLSNLVASAKGRSHLIMDYIEGHDISADAVRWGGYFHAECYRVLLPERKGISFLRESVAAPEIVGYLRRILESVNYQGVCGADFRIDSCGKPHFLECNPRFSGGLKTQIAAGFDIPWILWQLANGLTPSELSYTVGLVDADQEELDEYKRRL